MSMLSVQCARLRSWARQFDERADIDALAPLLASDLREAADTIISLRDRLQSAEHEITLLREKLRIANETGAKTCVRCGAFLSDDFLCTTCAGTAGTCNPVETATIESATVHVMECDECGGTYEHANGDYEHCPRCGRKTVER